MGVVTVSSAGGVRREWIAHLELSQAGTPVPHLYPQEVRRFHGRVRRYHPSGGTTLPPVRRYDGTTLVARGGTPVRFPSFLCRSHTWEDDRCTSCRCKGGTVVPARGALSTLLHSIHLFRLLSNDLGRRAAVQLQGRSWRHSE